MASKEADVFPQLGQQIELSNLSLQQLTQLKQQLDQVFTKLLYCEFIGILFRYCMPWKP